MRAGFSSFLTPLSANVSRHFTSKFSLFAISLFLKTLVKHLKWQRPSIQIFDLFFVSFSLVPTFLAPSLDLFSLQQTADVVRWTTAKGCLVVPCPVRGFDSLHAFFFFPLLLRVWYVGNGYGVFFNFGNPCPNRLYLMCVGRSARLLTFFRTFC